eukprot:6175124-Pleurochrysis_carterae.AAC.1
MLECVCASVSSTCPRSSISDSSTELGFLFIIDVLRESTSIAEPGRDRSLSVAASMDACEAIASSAAASAAARTACCRCASASAAASAEEVACA